MPTAARARACAQCVPYGAIPTAARPPARTTGAALNAATSAIEIARILMQPASSAGDFKIGGAPL
jgi:hypothetical protein